jgi:hypothetical protein
MQDKSTIMQAITSLFKIPHFMLKGGLCITHAPLFFITLFTLMQPIKNQSNHLLFCVWRGASEVGVCVCEDLPVYMAGDSLESLT